jgi:hypothetical protein
MAKMQYPEIKYKELEIKIASARKEINFWKRTVPQAFDLN